jgi:hypothetical protein
MLNSEGLLRLPKQEVKEGEKHGYIGESTGEVEVFEPTPPGNSNVVPDIGTAEARVKAAERALAATERDLAEARRRNAGPKKSEEPKAPVGATTPPSS